MTLREFVHIEIWSKRTSRKILIALGTIAIAFVVFYEVDTRWMSPKERRTAKEALLQLDALQAFTAGNDEQYIAADRTAKQKVDVALHLSLTSQDRAIAAMLSLYLMSVEMVTTSRKSDQQIEAKFGASHDPRLRELVLSRSQSSETSKTVNDFVSRSLHAVLD